MMYCSQNQHIFFPSRILLCLFLEMRHVGFLRGPERTWKVTIHRISINGKKGTQSCTSKQKVLSQNIPGDVKAAGHGIRLVSE